MSFLYVVATPIGNLEDMTFRAVRTLKEVDLILCEDTRTTRVLLSKYDIGTAMMSYHAKSALTKIDTIIEMLREGKNIALVSDAGTPAISDPGSLLISKVREALGDEVTISPIPGPSALVSALSASGLTGGSFTFYGFLPHKKGRETLFKTIADSDLISVFYESPHRIEKTLTSLAIHIPERKVLIARELTKIFEQIVSGTPEELNSYFNENPDKVRGEFVVMIEGK
jgi:16S rRNA (cytidine1402-2'-O)-methyltransferase